MAGEMEVRVPYGDIDSGKVLNKEGLLELSGQIKGYINTNIPQPYTLPTASTSTLGGVKVDGETITISDGVISATSSGGSSYTAGAGIDIDSNNVVNSVYNNDFIVSLVLQLCGKNTTLGGSVSDTTTSYTPSTVASIFKAGKALDTSYLTRNTQISGTTFCNSMNNTSLIHIDINQNGELTRAGINSSWFIIYPKRMYYYYHNCVISIYKDTTTQKFAGVPNILDLPTAPTTDGTYTLQCVVSSGTATYSWVSV